MFVDTHTHLFVDAFDEDRVEVVQRARRDGVEKLLLPNIDVSTISALKELVTAEPDTCFGMMGLHPSSVDETWESQLAQIKEELWNGSYIAVGEIGIDLYWDTTFIEQQKQVFRTQVQWAKELRLPIAIHAREAFDEIFEILDQENDESLSGVFHCFTGNIDQANHALSYGNFKLGIGGVVTYKKAELDKVLVSIPIENIILETDSPYLTPVPYRGKRNESSYLVHIAEKLSEIYSISIKEVEDLTTKSALELFKIPLSQ
jgi:TatD DNase family protein